MNKMTEKLVKDGSEGRRARRIKITFPHKVFCEFSILSSNCVLLTCTGNGFMIQSPFLRQVVDFSFS